MMELHWIWPLSGGALIGLSAGLYLLLEGRIAGISGMVASALGLSERRPQWLPALFLAGLLIGAAFALAWTRPTAIVITSSAPWLIAGGLLVGYGTRLGSGCTSGHGVCGMARLSPRSLVAMAVFMASAMTTVYMVRHVAGIQP
jgi:uncharacterized membrane protein YedE/YeeE